MSEPRRYGRTWERDVTDPGEKAPPSPPPRTSSSERIRVTYGEDRLGSRDYLAAHSYATSAITYLAEAVGRLNRPENDEAHPRVRLEQARGCIDRALACWEPDLAEAVSDGE